MASSAFGVYLGMLMGELQERQKAEAEKVKLLGDPEKSDKLVASFAKVLSPVKRAPAKGKFALETEGLDYVIPSDHPMKGYGLQLREKFTQALADPRYRGERAHKILKGLAEGMYTAKDPTTGESRYTESLRYKHMADTSLFQIGDDERFTKPPLYDQYRTAVKEEFKKAAAKEDWFASPRDIATSAGAFGAITALPLSITGPASGAAGFVTGAVTGALVETLAHPLRKFVHSTEWGQTRMHSDKLLDKAKVLGVDLALELPAVVRGEAVARRLFTIPRLAARQMVASPTAANVLNMSRLTAAAKAGATSEELATMLSGAVKAKYDLGLGVDSFKEALAVLKSGFSPRIGGAADPRRILFKALDRPPLSRPRGTTTGLGPTPEISAEVGMAEEAAYRGQREILDITGSDMTHEQVYKAFSGLDDVGLEEALNNPSGIRVGTLHAADRQSARELVTGVTPTTVAEKVSALRAARVEKTQAKSGVKVLDRMEEEIGKIEAWSERQAEKFPEKAEEIRGRTAELVTKTRELHAQTAAALGEVATPDNAFKVKNLALLIRKREALKDQIRQSVSLQARHREGQMVTLADRAKLGSIQAEVDKLNRYIRSIELELDPASSEVVKRGTGVSAGELDHGNARAALSEVQKEAYDAAVYSLSQGEGGLLKNDPEAVKKLLGRRVTYAGPREAEKLLTSESKKVQEKLAAMYKVDPEKTPAAITKEMEGLSHQEAYDAVDELHERLWTKYFPDRPYTEVPTEAVVEIPEGPLTVKMTGEEVLTKYADTSELYAKMSAKENAALDAAIAVEEKKAIAEGIVSPGERVPGITSLEHYKRIRTGKDLFTEHTGWRPVPAGAKEAEAAAALEGKYLPITRDDAYALVKEIGTKHTAGDIGNEEALHMMIQLDEAIAGSRNISDIDKMLLREGIVTGRDFTGPTAALPTSTGVIISQLKKRISLISFFAALGLSPALFNLFSPREAEAGVISSAAKAVPTAIKFAKQVVTSEALMKELADTSLIVPKVMDPNKVLMTFGEFMRGLPGDKAVGRILKNIGSWSKDVKPGIRHIFMSPYQKAEEALNIGKFLMNNPAVFRASYQAAEYVNRTNMETILTNMFRESGIVAAPKEVANRFKHLIPYMKDQVIFEHHTAEVARLTQALEDVGKGHGKKLSEDILAIDKGNIEKALASSQEIVQKLEGSVNEFHTRWAQTAEQAARELPTVRVYLSVWDGPEFKKAPFMKNITLSTNEQVLAGRLRKQLLEYKTRLDKAGVDTIKGPYMPVIMHPEFRAVFKDMIKGMDENTVAYMRFFRRSPHSRPLMPASETSMLYYVGDTERRLQNSLFWNDGWNEVEKRTSHLPLMAQVFKDLRDGIKPVDMYGTNRFANWYVQFEAMKRLWGNPSAGGKHLMKMTGTMISAGFKQSLTQVPKASRHLMKRALDLTETTRGALSRAGVSGMRRQDKLIDSFLHSMIPARNARHRLIDMGIHADEEVFSLWKNMWHSGQNIGASWINMAEVIDRGVSSLSGLEMAAKRGMTAEQAYYGSWDLLIKNNFLSRELNPGWLRDPKIRALLMFQSTPYKIFERRLVTAIRGTRAIKNMGKAVWEATRTPQGRTELLESLRTLRGTMKSTEQQFKVNLIADALKSEVDFFGTPVVNQFAKDILTIGAVTMGGASAGMNLKHHIFHLPFLSGMTYDPTVAFSPGILAAWRAHTAHQHREAGDDEWLMTRVLKKWLGPTWIAPDVIWKGKRITEGDIPEMYRDSKFKYLFAIPHVERKL